jgi:hypothetical protein
MRQALNGLSIQVRERHGRQVERSIFPLRLRDCLMANLISRVFG